MSSFLLSIISGAVGFVLIALTALGGLKVIKLKLKAHKSLGIATLFWALLHGTGALLLYFGVI